MAINPEGLQRLKRDDYLVLLVPGFLAQIYSALGRHAESELNRSIRFAARKVPFIGRRIAKEIPPIELPLDRDALISFHTLIRKNPSQTTPARSRLSSRPTPARR